MLDEIMRNNPEIERAIIDKIKSSIEKCDITKTIETEIGIMIGDFMRNFEIPDSVEVEVENYLIKILQERLGTKASPK